MVGRQRHSEIGKELRKLESLGANRDLGAGRGQQRGSEWMRDTEFTGMQHRNPRDERDMGSRLRTAMEVSAGTGGRGWRAGATSR